MYACPINYGEVPTFDCFRSNPLKFISDELYGAVPDVNYPERAYIPTTGESFFDLLRRMSILFAGMTNIYPGFLFRLSGS